MKKIITLHRWLGTFFSFLFLIWFLSGIVMMYKSFPFLSTSQKRALQQSATTATLKAPSEVFPDYRNDTLHQLRINYQLQRPVYHLTSSNGTLVSRYGDTGQQLTTSSERAFLLAKEALKTTAKGSVTHLTALDQWIPRTRYLKHLPIYKVTFDSPDTPYVYISSVTGEILSHTTASDRMWAWLGAIPHWIYFKDIRIHNELWFQLIVWLSGLGFVMVLTGIVTGWVRFQKKPKKPFQRFKNKWYNLHYYFGLFFGIFITTWIFSGWMSMTPLSWTPSTGLSKAEFRTWQASAKTLASISPSTWNNLSVLCKQTPFKEIQLQLFQQKYYVSIGDANGQRLVALDNKTIPKLTQYVNTVKKFPSHHHIQSATLLDHYDDYYYSRHNSKSLPIIRVQTTSKIYYYIDPKTTQVVYKCAPKNRVQRWIYHGLHSLDFSFLAWNRPLWDIIMIFLLLGGTVVCATGSYLGIKFLKRKNKQQKHRKNKKKRKKSRNISKKQGQFKKFY